MRKKNHFVGVRLSEEEYRHLMRQSQLAGMTVSTFIRQAVMDVHIRPRPPDAYAPLLRELSAIGNNVNQIAHWANAKESISEEEIQRAAELVRKAWRLVKETL